MVYPLLRHMIREKMLEEACWVSLNPKGPSTLYLDGIELRNVSVDDETLKKYGGVKERMWRFFHGIPDESMDSLLELAWMEDFAYYNLYNRVCSMALKELDREKDFDLFYVHDFQQLPTGFMLETLKPKVFRWHIPFDEKIISRDWADFLSRYFNAYEAVIVSCRAYLDLLKRLEYDGAAYHIYPYIDFSEYIMPEKKKVSELCDRFSIDEDDVVVAVVARLDPVKGHDIAVKALARAVKKIPNLKLVFVGNGSFSSSKQGLGLSKADRWRQHLKDLADSLGVGENIVFTGHVTQEELGCVYSRCNLTLLPSRAEGFGLVVAESWLYRKPPIVSKKAGIAELVEEYSAGILIDPKNISEVAEAIVRLTKDDSLRETLVSNGEKALEMCSIERGVKEEAEVLQGFKP